MKIIIDAKTGEIRQEEYTPPKKTKEQQQQDRAIEILEELEKLDKKVKRIDEDVIEWLYKETGFTPYSTTAEVINHKEDLRDELKKITKK